MLGGLEVRGVAGDPIIQVGPYAQLPSLLHLRIGFQPFHDIFPVGRTACRVAPVRLGHARRLERLAPFRFPMLRQVGRQAAQRRVQHARGVRANRTGWELAQHGHLVELEKISVPDGLEIRAQCLPCVFERFVDPVVAGRRVVQSGRLSQQAGHPPWSDPRPDSRPSSLVVRQPLTVTRPLDVAFANRDSHPTKVCVLHVHRAGVPDEEIEDELEEYGPILRTKRPSRWRFLALQLGIAKRDETHRLGRIHTLRPTKEFPVEAEVGESVRIGGEPGHLPEVPAHTVQTRVAFQAIDGCFPRQRSKPVRRPGLGQLGFLLFQERAKHRIVVFSQCVDLLL